jgi:plasmid replication initiation protein
MRLIGFDIFMDDGSFEHYNWFSSIKYKDGIATFTLTPEVKHYLCEFKEIKGYRVFAQLRYLLPMKSVYSKRIYLMCKEFVGSGVRFCDTNWDLFIDKLQIPKSYNVYNIQRQILDKAIEEINELSDIIVDYSITTEKEKGGSRPTGIKFTIRKKDVENDIEVEEQDLTTKMVDMSAEELRANIEKMQALLAEKES